MFSPIRPLLFEFSPGQKTILKIINNQAPVSRARITELSGLRSGSVTSICKELLSMQLINEGERIKTGRGQPIIPLQLNPYAGFSFGIVFHIKKIEVAVANFQGKLVDKVIFDYHESAPIDVILQSIHSYVQRLIEKHKLSQARILGMGVSIPGPHNADGKTIQHIQSMKQWQQVDVAKVFSDVFEFPVWIDNDCNIAVVGEFFSGQWPEAQDMILIELNHGIGGGLILNNKLFKGKNQNAGEIGTFFYSATDPNYKKPSIRELQNTLAEHGYHDDTIPDCDHPIVSKWLDSAVEKFLPAIYLTMSWFDPDCIVFSGSTAKHITDELIRRMALKEYWQQQNLQYEMTTVTSSRVGSELAALGACMYPIFQSLEN